MSLINLIKGRYKTVSIVGMAKNAGKTVVLNNLIQGSMEEGIRLAITSTGRDGEPLDIVTSTPKPLIYMPQNTLIATASSSIAKGDCVIEIMESTGISTALGEIMIGRSRTPGHVEIAGPDSNSGIKDIISRLQEHGCNLVLVDGAINRIASASPAITEACILATGAVLSRTMDKVVEETLHRVALLSLEKVDEELKTLIHHAMDNSPISIIDKSSNVFNIDIKTALGSGKIIAQHIDEESRLIVIRGSLTKSTVEDMLGTIRRYKDLQIIVQDGTKIFIEPKDWQLFIRAGLKTRVLEPIKVVAVTINPYSPEGYYFDRRDFLQKMQSHLSPIEVYDVLG